MTTNKDMLEAIHTYVKTTGVVNGLRGGYHTFYRFIGNHKVEAYTEDEGWTHDIIIFIKGRYNTFSYRVTNDDFVSYNNTLYKDSCPLEMVYNIMMEITSPKPKEPMNNIITPIAAKKIAEANTQVSADTLARLNADIVNTLEKGENFFTFSVNNVKEERALMKGLEEKGYRVEVVHGGQRDGNYLQITIP